MAHQQRYTEADDAIISEGVRRNIPRLEIARELGRSYAGIAQRERTLGLRREQSPFTDALLGQKSAAPLPQQAADDAFVIAMRTAIAAGAEHAVEGVITVPCTVAPRLVPAKPMIRSGCGSPAADCVRIAPQRTKSDTLPA